jgi:hypothetical protein
MGVRCWSVVLLLALAPLTATSAVGAADPEGQRPGIRDQWQPQTDHEARLPQPIHTEILGRAAVPALQEVALTDSLHIRTRRPLSSQAASWTSTQPS